VTPDGQQGEQRTTPPGHQRDDPGRHDQLLDQVDNSDEPLRNGGVGKTGWAASRRFDPLAWDRYP